MSAAVTNIEANLPAAFQGANGAETTLLDLVSAVWDVAENEAEVVATVLHLLRSGRARLCGNFRGVDPAEFS